MGSLQQQRWHDVAYWGILLLACVVFWVMNCLTPFKEDDMAFTLVEGEWRPVSTLLDILRSHATHMVHTNGRLADVVPELFCGLLGKSAFNVCNALAFGLLAHLISLLSTHRRSITTIALFLAVVGTCYPVPGETMLWVSGSANYMWAITLSLLLAHFLLRYRDERLAWGRALALMPLAFIAGGFNEATSIGFLAGFGMYHAANPKFFNGRVALVLLGYFLGLLLIVLSPAAWERAAGGGIVLNLGLGDLMSSRWLIFHEKMSRFIVPAMAIAGCVVAVAMKRGREVKESPWPYIFLCLMAVMFVLGILHERAYAPWVTVSLIIVAMAVDMLLPQWHWSRMCALAILLALSVFTFARGVNVLKQYNDWNTQIEREIVASPIQAVLLERQFDGYSRFIKLMNYRSTHYFAHEVIYRAYYGKRNVQFVSDSVYSRYHEGRLLDGVTPLRVQSDRPDLMDSVLVIPGQRYALIPLKADTLPATSQTARYVFSGDGQSPRELTAEEQVYAEHGIKLNYSPEGFYPLEYQGRCYLICRPPKPTVSQMVFPLRNEPVDGDEVTITLL